MEKAHKQIRDFLRINGIPQYEFAVKIGITAEHASRLLSGRNIPSAPVRKLIAHETGLDVAEKGFWHVDS